MRVSNTNCDYCHEKLSDWDYRYHGKHYCRKCYDYLFHFKTCSVCKQRRKIYYDLKTPICKFCQVKDKPCIRCGKEEYSFGKITEHGAVCASCAKYFTEHKSCTKCKKKNFSVSQRNLPDGTIQLICQTCYRKNLPVCSSCGYRRDAYSYDIKTKKALCKTCSIEVTRICKSCNSEFPAGFGKICSNCIFSNALAKKTKFISASLSSYMSGYFNDFSAWLKNRRGVNYASIRIQHYHPYFIELDTLCEELKRLPTYEELVDHFTVAKTREHLSVTIFFDKRGLIQVDKKTQEKYANLDMIDRYLISFEKSTYKHKFINEYYQYLELKLANNKTTIRSVRLALTPAVKFLKYCDNFKDNKPNMNMLKGYLWCYPGQRAAITGFINFLKKKFGYKFSIKEVPEAALKRPKTSKEILKQRLIDLLKKDQKIRDSQYLIKTAIEYLHRIEIPNNVFINFSNIKKMTSKVVFVNIANYRFYLPILIYEKLAQCIHEI